jgi:RNA polymerase sigma factor (TIGR02999 family)
MAGFRHFSHLMTELLQIFKSKQSPLGSLIASNPKTMSEITLILEEIESGNSKAAERLLPLVYDELRKLAASRMAQERSGHTLQPTALVHEAWLRLGGEEQPEWNNRGHFFSAAAEAMRRILVDRARRRLTAKRGDGVVPLDLAAMEISIPTQDDDGLLRIHEALDKLSLVDPQKAELVKLRFFMGMNYREAADALGISKPTAKLWWAYTRAWLSVELRELS